MQLNVLCLMHTVTCHCTNCSNQMQCIACTRENRRKWPYFNHDFRMQTNHGDKVVSHCSLVACMSPQKMFNTQIGLCCDVVRRGNVRDGRRCSGYVFQFLCTRDAYTKTSLVYVCVCVCTLHTQTHDRFICGPTKI